MYEDTRIVPGPKKPPMKLDGPSGSRHGNVRTEKSQ